MVISSIGGSIGFADALVMTNEFIVPTISFKNQELADHLINEMRSGADNTISIFFISIPVGILMVILIIIMNWVNLSKKRSVMAKTLTILPSEFVFLNRPLRAFMVK